MGTPPIAWNGLVGAFVNGVLRDGSFLVSHSAQRSDLPPGRSTVEREVHLFDPEGNHLGEFARLTLRGQVLDANVEAAIPAAEVVISGAEGYRLRLLTDSLGSFMVRLPAAGSYWLRASALGYAVSDSAGVTLEHSREMVQVQLRLSVDPLGVEGITVVSRGLELRHQATFEGFLERHKTAPSVGSARVVSIEDPIMATSPHVGDLLDWFPVERRECTVVYVDGRLRLGWGNVDMEPITGLAGVEFYVDYRDAPLEFRGGGPPCLRSPKFSVLVLWREKPPGGGSG